MPGLDPVIPGSRFLQRRRCFGGQKLSYSSKALPRPLPGSGCKKGGNMIRKVTLVAVFLVVPPVLLTLTVLVTTYLLSVLFATSGILG
jgi:hypothetical protein